MRQTRMRGVNLDLFDFDYDLTWMGFFLDADDRILGRYGGRDPESPDSRVSLAGLRYAMQRALQRHRTEKKSKKVPGSRPRTVDDFPATKRLPAQVCIHCHQVYDLRRESLQSEGKWKRDELWVYPLPENLGLHLQVDQGDLVRAVDRDSPAFRVGIRPGDKLVTANEQPISSFADLQYTLHRAPAKGDLSLCWERAGMRYQGKITLAEGWRKTDLSWRWSLRGVDPPPWVQGTDLSPEEKQKLGLAKDQLALELGPFMSVPARQAGIQQGDILLGVDGKALRMSGQQFAAYIRLHYQVGDRVVYTLLRAGKRLEVPLILRGRHP